MWKRVQAIREGEMMDTILILIVIFVGLLCFFGVMFWFFYSNIKHNMDADNEMHKRIDQSWLEFYKWKEEFEKEGE